MKTEAATTPKSDHKFRRFTFGGQRTELQFGAAAAGLAIDLNEVIVLCIWLQTVDDDDGGEIFARLRLDPVAAQLFVTARLMYDHVDLVLRCSPNPERCRSTGDAADKRTVDKLRGVLFMRLFNSGVSTKGSII